MRYLRLNRIIKFVTSEMNCADIGADHGFVTIGLAKRFSNNNFVAVENKEGPFNILKNNVKKEHLTNVKCFFNDGLNPINESINTVIIAGMGGNAIINIIKNNIKKTHFIKYFIIDAHNDGIQVIKFMYDLGYCIENSEEVIENGIKYNIFLFKKTDCKVCINFSSYYKFYIRNKTNLLRFDVISSEGTNLLKNREKFISLRRFKG